MSEARRFTIGGALVAAVAASSCCLGPVLLGALGIGGVGAFTAIGHFRSYMLGGAAVLLGSAFFRTYRRPRNVASADACGCSSVPARRTARVGLWSATIIALVLVLAPTVVARALTAPATSSTVSMEEATLRVQGIDCQACAAPMRRALERVGGLHDLALDIDEQLVIVRYEPAPGRLEAYTAAINDLGYETTVSRAPRR